MYNLVRFYKDRWPNRRVIKAAVTLEEVRQHCGDPETSSSTCKGPVGRRRTRQVGEWFDGYEAR